ncbi:hypothetical protein [Collimonas sp.]|jgi:hypothetical protein|uniref:hypothetical protein n=1 Tax=Collimonas sp. TaxID=1963772 RepID=UPI002B699946|nr:hypothetical protein [Collimonas sp.]HWX04008.1 hypothetical protein [Collimonas sp.]
MVQTKGFPYKGNAVFPSPEKQDSGKYAACFTIRSGKDGAGEIRYARAMPSNEFDTEDEAISYILDFAGDWIDHNPA